MKQLSVQEIVQRFRCECFNPNPEKQDLFLGVMSLERAENNHISFLANARYLKDALRSRAGAIVCESSVAEQIAKETSAKVFVSKEPYAVFARISQFFFEQKHPFKGISPLSYISEDAEVDPSAHIAPFVFIAPKAKIGKNTVVYPNAFVGESTVIGDDCILYPSVVVREGCKVGNRCILNPGCVIGGDGFGFAPSGMENIKIPQIGGVVIGDDVEIGSNSSLDRATTGNTEIGDQSKLDSLVLIAHNVKVGKACFLAGFAGVAGSSTIGNRVMFGGQATVSGHVKVTDNVMLCAKSGVTKDLDESGTYNGVPAVPNAQYLKEQAWVRRGAKQAKPTVGK